LINKPINKIFVSATPIKKFMNITENYTYSWEKAIQNKYICDLNIFLPDIPEINKYIEIIQDNYTENEIKLMRKAYNLIKSMLFNGDRRCICYLTTIEKAQIFNRMLSFVGNIFNIEIDRAQIDCNTRRIKRGEIIQKFKNSTKLFILLNVHVLDEGIDIPECDSVCITQPNNNIINIVQRMCRANRIYLNKTSCNIYLWCSEKKTTQILDYLFTKTNGCIENKIYKSCNNVNEKIAYTHHTSFVCKHCKKEFTSKQNYDNHINKNICTMGEYECKSCNRKFTTRSSMYRHVNHICKLKQNEDIAKQNKDNEYSDIFERLIILEEKHKQYEKNYEKIEKLKRDNKYLKQVTDKLKKAQSLKS